MRPRLPASPVPFFAILLLAGCSAPGEAGPPGANGAPARVELRPEAAGENCAQGGIAVLAGVDADADGALADSEVTSTEYVCNAAPAQDGLDALVRVEPDSSGDHCPGDGTVVYAGIDRDGDGVLDETEITSTQYVCDGEQGASTLIRVVSEPAGEHCTYGGTAVESGPDGDGDGVLGDAEVAATSYLCEKRQNLWVLQIEGMPGRGDERNSLSLLERGSRGVQLTVDLGTGSPGTLALDPGGESFWVSRQSGSVERRAMDTGALLESVAFPSARDMVLIPSLGRLYVAGYENVGVIDLSTSTLIATVPLNARDQTLAIDASPAGDEVVLAVLGNGVRLAFIDTATNAVTQSLTVPGYPFDVMHLGSRVVTWDDNSEEFRFYDPAPWAETASDRQSFAPDGGSSGNAVHNMLWNPEDRAIYVFQAVTTAVVKTTVGSPTAQSTFPVTQAYHHLMLDGEGAGIEGVRWPPNTATSFEHLALPSGNTSASSWDASGLPGGMVVHLLPVTME